MLHACAEGAVPFIEEFFHDCVYSLGDAVGFVLGLASIALWITAQLPQFIDNIKNQSAEALSVWFLAQWFLGDTLNLLGCLMSGEQLATTTALAMYFVLSDVAMLTQFVYFGALQRRKALLLQKQAQAQARRAKKPHHHPPPPAGSHASQQHLHHHHRRHHNNHRRHGSQEPLWSADVVGLIPGSRNADTEAGHTDTTIGSNEYLGPAPGAGGISTLGTASALGPSARTTVVATAVAGSVLTLVALGTTASFWQQGQPGWNMTFWHHTGADDHVAGLGIALYTASNRQNRSEWPSGIVSGRSSVNNVGRDYDDDEDEDEGGGGSGGGDIPWWEDTDQIIKVLGSICGYCSTCLYLSSRTSQIYKNWSRKSAEGLSVVMFIFTICANLCTGVSICLRLKDFQSLMAQLPWVLGAFGTVGLDVFIFNQARWYNRLNAQPHIISHASPNPTPAEQHRTVDAETGQGSHHATNNPLLQPLMPE